MPWTREEKIYCISPYLKTKSFKTVSKVISKSKVGERNQG